jgi:hypothetical protein
MKALCPKSVLIFTPVCISHIFIVLSALPLTILLSSDDKKME